MTIFTPIEDSKKAINEALTQDQETLVLASLPVNTWTNFPASTANPGRTIAGFNIRSATGESLLLDTRLNGGVWQVMSAIALTNIQISVEY